MMMSDDINSLILDIVKTDTMIDHRKDETVRFLIEEVALLKAAAEKIDVTNLRYGPYINTCLVKIKEQKEVLEKNHEKVSDYLKRRMMMKYNRMLEVIDEKVAYGEQVNKYLEKKDESLIETIKSNLLDADIEDFQKIREKLLSFKQELIDLSEEIEKITTRLCKAKKNSIE